MSASKAALRLPPSLEVEEYGQQPCTEFKGLRRDLLESGDERGSGLVPVRTRG
ncbi:hypothetical protein [Streptomyces sp. NPDC046862]|uniref:hypothetical protein n=1 Tax=Streptomyces sp. NPDC046862 TaxID=3154603 RepID=UPI0034547D1E